MPGGAQSTNPLPGCIQAQPACASVTSVTAWESVDTLGLPEERSVADEWPSASPCVGDIALGNDGDSQAPIVSAPTTTNKVTPGLNTFDMFDLARKLKFLFGPT